MSRSNMADEAKLQYEAGQTLVAMAALTDSGDRTKFTAASKPWSRKSGFEASVIPNGLVSGEKITPTAGQNDKVDIPAKSFNLAGVLTSVGAAAATAVTRAVSMDTHIINSITVDSAGAIAVIAGTDSTAFSETRGGAGGPPFIPVGSIEIGQVRLSSNVAAPVTAAEIFEVPGQHSEWSNYPVWDESNVDGSVTFSEALPASHTGSVPKKIYTQYYTPSFADVSLSSDFAPPENSYSVSSTQIYGRVMGKTTSSLGQGKFTAYLSDGVTDPLIALKGSVLWFKFFPDKHKTPYILTQGKLGISRVFPAADSIKADCSVSAEEAGKEFAA